MILYQTRALALILRQPKVLYSTATKSKINTESLFQKLFKEFSDSAYIIDAVRKDEAKNIHFNEWKSRILVLKRFDFKDKECFRMISKYPGLLKIPLDDFEDTVEQWFNANLGFRNFKNLLKEHPELIGVRMEVIQKRVPYLRSLFKNADALALLLFNSPNVMCDNWKTVLSKIYYLVTVRRFKMFEVAEGCALSKSMDLLKFRLDLLEKCGIFKQEFRPVHKINKYDKTSHRNPHLKDICLSNTKDFVKIAKISTEEYAACRDLYMTSEEDDEEDEEPNTYQYEQK